METVAQDGQGVKAIVQVNETAVRGELKEMVRQSVEETLNGLLDAEADRLCQAGRYERNAERVDTRAGTYERGLLTSAGKVALKVPKLRTLAFDTQIIERYRRRESSVEEALVEMYLAGVSVRRMEDITAALWGEQVSPSTISELNQKVAGRIEEWRNRPLTGRYEYVWLDGIWLKRSWGGEVKNVAVLVATGVNADGFREVLGVSEGMKEDHESWLNFLRHLKARGLSGAGLFVSDCCQGLVEAIATVYPESGWQRCMVHWFRNVFAVVPRTKAKEVAAMLKAIHAQEDRAAALAKAREVEQKLLAMKLPEAAKVVREGVEATIRYMSFPREHWAKVRTTNPLERIMREIRRRTRVVGNFPDGKSAMILVAARLRHIAGTRWGMKKYMDIQGHRKEAAA